MSDTEQIFLLFAEANPAPADAPPVIDRPAAVAVLRERREPTMLTQEPKITEPGRSALRRRWSGPAIAVASFLVIALFAGLAWLWTASDGEQPVATTVAPPTTLAPTDALDIRIVDPDGKITSHAATITRLIEETHAQAAPLLGIENVAVTYSVTPDNIGAVPEDWGVGYQFADWEDPSVVVAVDPWLPGFSDVLDEQMSHMVAMAAYDVARGRAAESGGLEYTGTLLDEMVWAGIAFHFAEELLGTPTVWWADVFPESETQKYMDEARPLLDTTEWDPSIWFRRGTTEIPAWTGTTLGYRIVETYLADHPELTAADLAYTPGSVFRPAETAEE